MTDEDNAYQGKLLLIWFFTSCSFHSSTGAAQSMKFFPKKRNQYSQLVTEL